MRDKSAEIRFQSFLQEAVVSSSIMGRDDRSWMLPIQHFVCRSRCRLPFKMPRRMVLKRLSFSCDMPEPCKFPSLDSSHKRFLRIIKEVDLDPHPVAGLMLQVEDAQTFSQALGFEILRDLQNLLAKLMVWHCRPNTDTLQFIEAANLRCRLPFESLSSICFSFSGLTSVSRNIDSPSAVHERTVQPSNGLY